MNYDRKDRFYKKAKEEGYLSRAAYKLLEMDKRFQLLKQGMKVVDVGCAPGGWLQVVCQKIGFSGRVVGVDLEDVEFKKPNLITIVGDLREESIQQSLFESLATEADLVLSDISPHLSGVKFRDYYQSFELAHLAFEVALKTLRKGGNFVVKIFPGAETEKFRKEIKGHFKNLKTFIPEATRKTSEENYLVAQNLL